MKTGIYRTIFTKTNECYIGWNRNIDSLFDQIDSGKKKGQKSNSRFHDLYDEFGRDAFKIEVLEEHSEGASKELLNERKLHFINKYKPTLNNKTDYNKPQQTPLEVVLEKMEEITASSSSKDDNEVMKRIDHLERGLQEIKDEYLNPIYNKLRELQLLITKG